MPKKVKKVDLFGTAFDQEPSRADVDRIQAWLTEDASHVAQFVDHALIHNDLRRLALAEDILRYQENVPENQLALLGRKTHTASHSSRTGGKWVAALAVALAAGLAAISVTMLPGDESKGLVKSMASVRPNAASPTERPREAARLAATVSDATDCRPTSGGVPISHGRPLRTGSVVEIESGLAQLTFEEGAVVVIQGPCRLTIEDNGVKLASGRLSVTVPRSAVGFSVDTPNSQVVDLGTEFGVEVDAAGDTEVHVFKGEVVSRRTDAAGNATGKFIHLTANNAILFPAGSDEAREFEADEKAFVHQLRRERRSVQFPSTPVDGALLLWLAADHGVLSDETGRVYAWLDTITASSDHIADNALQPVLERQPRIIANALAAKPAVRFDGLDDCLTTTPMANGESQTIAFVASFNDQAAETGQIINYNGPPQIATSEWGRQSVLQIRACLDPTDGRPLVDPFIYAGKWRGEELLAGRMENESREATAAKDIPAFGRPFIAVYVYDVLENRAELFIDGHSYGRSTAPIPATLTSRKVIARHGGLHRYFHGDIAELLIYDEGLDDARIMQLTRFLGNKYAIHLD